MEERSESAKVLEREGSKYSLWLGIGPPELVLPWIPSTFRKTQYFLCSGTRHRKDTQPKTFFLSERLLH